MQGERAKCRWLCISVATLMAIGALVSALVWPAIFDSVLASQLALTPTSRTFKQWEAPEIPLKFEIFLFNWTNADDFPGTAPNVQELGPYVFTEHRRHENITWHSNNASLAYRTRRVWHFYPEASIGSLDDNITTLNAIAASAAYRSRSWGFMRQKGLSVGLSMFGEQISVTKSARELLFEGYENPLLDIAKTMPASATDGAPLIDKFGWFFGRNDTLDTDGYMEVTTGTERGVLPGQMLKWNHEDHLPYYSGDCSRIAGSAGEFLPRDLTEESTLLMFIPDLCRPVNMDYVESGQINGLDYHKYSLTENSFDNTTLFPSHTCFCNGECAWGGVMNVSACRFGSPAFITLPHFLYGDQELRELVTGLEPDVDKHSFYFAVEPNLGVPVDVAARFQLNLYIENYPNIMLFDNVPRLLFPVLWVQQRVILDENIASELKFLRTILDKGAIFCMVIAAFFTILVTMAIITLFWRRKPKYIQANICEKPEAEMKLRPAL